MPSLIFMAGPIAGRRYRLQEGEYVVGRRSDCQIFVPDMRVSRQHARVWKQAETWTVEDLGSNNGTYVNGVRLTAAVPLRSDDEITIANNRIRVEGEEAATDTVSQSTSGLTIVHVPGQAIRSREDSDAPRAIVSSGLFHAADQKAVRLIERKLDALTQILYATAASDTAEALLEKLAGALLDLFPQAEDVGVLVEDEKTHELRVQCQRHRPREPVATPAPEPNLGFSGSLRVPRTIIMNVVNDRRSVLLGESADEADDALGARMGAPLIYRG